VTDHELFERFCDTSLPVEAFPHREHVRTAWLFVQRFGMPAALTEFSTALKRFAEAKGKTTLYHETITWAYLMLIAERQNRTTGSEWATFAEANSDLLSWKPSILDTYYTAETLWSDQARRSFVMPDRIVK
jgi:hypothetical protein